MFTAIARWFGADKGYADGTPNLELHIQDAHDLPNQPSQRVPVG
jgi:hypothetical protein